METAVETEAVSAPAVAVRVVDPVIRGYPFLSTEKVRAPVVRVDGGALKY